MRYLFFIIIITFIISCKNETKSNLKYFGQTRYSANWIVKNKSGKISEKVEMLSLNGSSFTNQNIELRNNIIQNGSQFYELKLVRKIDNKKSIYKLAIHSFLDSINSKKIVEYKFDFAYTQQIQDSIFLKTASIKNSNDIVFEYVDFNNKLIEGVVNGLIIVKTPNPNKLEVREFQFFVTNQNTINSKIVKTFKINK